MKRPTERQKPGAKPKENRKIPVTVYVEETIVSRNGGMVEMRKKVLEVISKF